ncbi:hypothetical protein QCM80_06465 [Bradyrhizobium sp. SSUT112]|uniref:hypothetical protein n=1 Tax=Bradyrhizobium sp. SSUT112 TaxID=3040604 RepID=UPI00244C895F|nr:hypothetical protein [Bradyrhizobium sp. SSUT112]MDH2350320.1 hypothetical protein [Bradyrhizobium sp. SSUT112]
MLKALRRICFFAAIGALLITRNSSHPAALIRASLSRIQGLPRLCATLCNPLGYLRLQLPSNRLFGILGRPKRTPVQAAEVMERRLKPVTLSVTNDEAHGSRLKFNGKGKRHDCVFANADDRRLRL